MYVEFVDAINMDHVFSYTGNGGTVPVPVTGDVLVTTDQRQWRVLQRAILTKNLGKPNKDGSGDEQTQGIAVYLQCAVCPAEQASLYMSKLGMLRDDQGQLGQQNKIVEMKRHART